MSILTNKIDFAVILTVKNANPNGDPLNGNRPRCNYDGYGEISDVCLKRKIRNRLLNMGQPVFVQSDDNKVDCCKSLRERAESCEEVKKAGKDREKYAAAACEQWIDVRAFGQVFAFSGKDEKGVSVGVRGPVSIHSAVSLSPVDISSMQITKSVNSETKENPDKKNSDTMGLKHRVDFGTYVFYGSINPQLASKTGFSEQDSELIHQSLITLFENDSSSARPDGSMEVYKVYWWKHNSASGQHSSAKVHRSLHYKVHDGVDRPKAIQDYDFSVTPLDGLIPEICDGI
jgi:CRISPR-associated protein Csd2